ncbi:hypothetical protein OROHE_024515 [Orobanche hederae]
MKFDKDDSIVNRRSVNEKACFLGQLKVDKLARIDAIINRWKWIYVFTETALAVTMHGPTKAHSYHNMARAYYHSKGDYKKAGMYYMASVKESNSAHEFVLPYNWYVLSDLWKMNESEISDSLEKFVLQFAAIEKFLKLYHAHSVDALLTLVKKKVASMPQLVYRFLENNLILEKISTKN